MVKSRAIYKVQEFDGFPKLTDFKIVEENVDEDLREGEFLTEALAFSLDPFIWVYKSPITSPVIGFQTCRVLSSKNEKYPKGSTVMTTGGWKTVRKVTDETVWYRMDQFLSEKISVTAAVGVLGMTGMTSYFGLLEVCKPEPGETVFVNGCAGAVGNLVGQIAKLKGCKVVGCCGSDEKCEFAKSIGFDAVFNYKTVKSWKDEISKVAPKGIDCFFDNVGGQLASDIIHAMNAKGRISVCGAICNYSDNRPDKADMIQKPMASKRLTMQGFVVSDFKDRFDVALKDIAQWIEEGKITVQETVTVGFEKLPQALIGMLNGENFGKAVVKT